MSAYALSGSSFTLQGKAQKSESGRKVVLSKIVMGDGSSTYPTGGIALAGAFLGLPVTIESIKIIDNGEQGINYTWDSVNQKLRGFITGLASAVESELTSGFTMPVHSILVEAKGW